MDRSKVLDKVTKLMALANSSGTTPNEAETALRQARYLMQRYNLEETELQAFRVESFSCLTDTRSMPPPWLHMLAITCAEAFDCKCLACYDRALRGMAFKFIGLGVAPQMASYAYAALKRQLVKARQEHVARQTRCKLSTKRRRGQLFAEGWIHAVAQKVAVFAGMDAESEQQISAYIEIHHPVVVESSIQPTKTSGAYDRRSRSEGWQQGERAQLHHGVTQSVSERLALGGRT